MSKRADTLLGLAKIEQGKGNFENAVKLYMEALADNTTSSAYWGLGVCCINDMLCNRMYAPGEHPAMLKAAFAYFTAMAGCDDAGPKENYMEDIFSFTESVISSCAAFIVANAQAFYKIRDNVNIQWVMGAAAELNLGNKHSGYADNMRAYQVQQAGENIKQLNNQSQLCNVNAQTGLQLMAGVKERLEEFIEEQYPLAAYLPRKQKWDNHFQEKLQEAQFEMLTPAQRKEELERQKKERLRKKQEWEIADEEHVFHSHKKNAQQLLEEKKYNEAYKAASAAQHYYHFDKTVNNVLYEAKKAIDTRASTRNWIIFIILCVVIYFIFF